MYDDYDLDYSYTPEYTYDLDETYDMWVQSYAHTQLDDLDLDDEYARDTQDYDALAYKHYAWYSITHTHTHLDTMLAQKRRFRVTLDIECYDDLDLESYVWNDVLGLEGDETVDYTIKEEEVNW